MATEKPMNLNKTVWVKLSDHGKKLYNPHEYDKAGGDWLKFPLWELMGIFGRHMYLGSNAVFEDNEIHFEKPEGAD